LVDEYQDTNYAQQRIIDQLSMGREHLCLVGDDAQSIYAFRGANIDYMLNFQTDKRMKIFKLEQNYRSTQHIVQAANTLISHNRRQIRKEVYSNNDKGDKLMLIPTYSDKEESAVVCKEIRRIKSKDGCAFNEFCVLYRTNAQSRSFEEEMRKHSIPYRVYGGLSFYQRKEIKDIIAYLRVVVNPDDEEAMKRIINYPLRGIGSTTVQKLIRAANTNHVSLWQVLSSPVAYGLSLSKGTLNKILSFRDLILSFIEKRDSSDAYELGKEIIVNSGIQSDILSDNSPEGLSRQQNVDEFASALSNFVDEKREEGTELVPLSSFLEEVALVSDTDKDDLSSDRVSLMTVHAAKGLEFSTVFIVGLEDNIFPSQRSLDSLKELEEERRLMYVAITRAKKYCYLTCARSRYRYGKMEFGNPSRFIKEIDPDLIRVKSGTRFTPSYNRKIVNTVTKPRLDFVPANKPLYGAIDRSSSAIPSSKKPYNEENTSSLNLRKGSVIEHQRFGIGTVDKLEGEGENTKATVVFRNVGVKQLLLKFARYQIVKY